ncbi:MAG: EamA family transporter [Christensenella sp.]|uniref:DMT family transporter n=1 Tax=Christensenella sp. TaxID=1935934 RepID=UPI002B1FDA90|nr:EamA family transporter [Christensenella sp.]MEA5003663.1 EamA family transporter [Christensenella sp.]
MEHIERRILGKGIALMICSALSACVGQLMWKMAAQYSAPWYYLAGIVLYGIGMLFMLLALRHGELSVLHPMLSLGFVLSLFLGVWFLGEQITVTRVLGIAAIIIGMLFLSRGERKQ